jgi:hypothetical protein
VSEILSLPNPHADWSNEVLDNGKIKATSSMRAFELRGFAPIGIVEWWSNGMMDELVLNEVEGKEFLTIKMVYFRFYPQYSSIPTFHSSMSMA